MFKKEQQALVPHMFISIYLISYNSIKSGSEEHFRKVMINYNL